MIGATNRQEYVDSMIRRNGRFDREISMGIPNQESRYDILQVLLPYPFTILNYFPIKLINYIYIQYHYNVLGVIREYKDC